MQETTITCDVCGEGMEEENHFELKGVFDREGASDKIDESLTVDLDDICSLCSVDLLEAIEKVMQRRKPL